jgi:hypothetical protein
MTLTDALARFDALAAEALRTKENIRREVVLADVSDLVPELEVRHAA